LTGKAFDTLQLLVEDAGTLLQQQSLMDRLWPNIFVEQRVAAERLSAKLA